MSTNIETKTARVSSMDDQSIEEVIQGRGLAAPRVTPADIEAAIVGEYYFTAAEGFQGALAEGLYNHAPLPPMRHADLIPLQLLTFCVLVLKNQYTVTGESACASSANFDPELGRKIARQNAVSKVWPLLGFELRSRLAGEGGLKKSVQP